MFLLVFLSLQFILFHFKEIQTPSEVSEMDQVCGRGLNVEQSKFTAAFYILISILSNRLHIRLL